MNADRRPPARARALAGVICILSLCGCFTTFKTAKTVEGASLTVGAQRWSIEESGRDEETHTFLVALARAGRAARQDRVGFEVGARLVTDVLDRPDRDPGWLVTIEPRLQPRLNGLVDVSLGAELVSFFYPAGLSLHLSRDVTRWLTPYTEIKAQFLLWQLAQGERVHELFPRLTFGAAFAAHRFGTFYIETEGYKGIEAEDSWRLNVGYELPAVAGGEAPPDSLRPPPRKRSRGIE